MIVLHKPDLEAGIITVFFSSKDSSSEAVSRCDISMLDFWNYVKNRDLHSYVDDYYDPNEPDGHAQVTGKLELEEYMHLPTRQIANDLTGYLKSKEL